MASTLSAGDIAIVGVNADNPDAFSFVALVDLDAGTEVLFTDSGVLADGSFRANEGAVRWTAPADTPAGTVVSFEGTSGAFTTANDASVGTSGFNLSTSGDQVIAFRGPTDAPTFLFAVQTNATAFQSEAASSNTSALPPGLTPGLTAVAVGASENQEVDNSLYAGPLSGTRDALLGAIANPVNWTGSNTRIDPLTPGPFSVTPAAPQPTVVNEVLGSTMGADSEYIELFGAPGASLAGLSLIFVESDAGAANGTIDRRIDFADDARLGDNGFFLLANGTAAATYLVTPNLDFAENFIENSSYTLALVETASLSGDTVTGAEVVVDAVAVTDGENEESFFFGAPVIGPDGPFLPAGAGRDADGTGAFQILNFNNQTPPNTPTAGTFDDETGSGDDGSIDDDATPISAVQGSGDASPLVGQTVVIEAVVTGDFQDGDADAFRSIGGFFVMEETADRDSDAATSEGLFVSDSALTQDGGAPALDVAEGDVVRVLGVVTEFFGRTQITATEIRIETPAAVTDLDAFAVSTPLPALHDREAVEGMLLAIEDPLTFTESFDTEQFGEITVATGGEVINFTQDNAPSVEGFQAHLAEKDDRTIRIDDGMDGPRGDNDPIVQPDGDPFAVDQGIRMGQTLTPVTAVMDFNFGAHKLRLPGFETFETDLASNPRPGAPADLGGSFTVAAYNVLNYFTTFGSRGAENEAEFDRQTEKLVTGFLAIDADVVALVEVENNGVAIATLTAELNARFDDREYAFVDTGIVGTDAITVGFVYDTLTTELAGDFAILDDDFFVAPLTPGDDQNRAAVAQTFREMATGGEFTAVANHFKSKGSLTGNAADQDQGDGAGANNATRTAASVALLEWLETDPTGSGDEDFIILGDLNAYARETPITTLEAAGYVNTVATFEGLEQNSFRFSGEIGTLDYAMAIETLNTQVTGATSFNINADEMFIFDYNLDSTFNNDTQRPQDQGLFDGQNPAKSSDHDAIIVGLDLASDTPATLNVTRLAQFNSGVGSAGSEVVAFEDGRFYVTNGEADRIDVFTLSDGKVGEIDLSGLPNYGALNSVAVKNGVVAVAIQNATITDPGFVALIPVDDLSDVSVVTAGALPDMVTFSADGAKVYVANEGSPEDGVDPQGGIGIITLDPADLGASTVQTADFTAFDGTEDTLREQGVRIFPGKTFSNDAEPEYIAVDPVTGNLIVTLQEANAVALVDVATAMVTEIRALGTVDHSVEGQGIDASDRDDTINIRTWPVTGLRMPDSIAAFQIGDQTFYATANEGDARDEDERAGSVTLDPTAFPDAATLQLNENLGRLNISSIDGDADGDGDFDQLFSYGSRGFTIYDAGGTVVFDSGDQFEQFIAANFPERFNSTQATRADPTGAENRSDDKGPEPEAIAIAEVEGRMIAVIGLERDSGLMLYDVSDPANATFLRYVNGVNDGDLAPEIITVIAPEDSATGRTEIAVSYEESGTTSVFELTFQAPSDPGDFGPGDGPDPLDPTAFGFDLQITEIWPGNEPGDNLTPDWIEITNFGDAAWTASVDPDLFYDDESRSFEDADQINGVAAIAPGESIVVVIDEESGVAEFRDVWGALLPSGAQVGWSDGAGLGQGGDGASLMFGAFEERAELDFELFPDAEANGGQSWDVSLAAFSTDNATQTVNDAGQPAIGTPGALPDEAPQMFTLELFHIADQEAAFAATGDAPRLSGVLNALRAQDLGDDGIEDNTLLLSSGDAFIPGLFFNASADVYGARGVADILIQNELGVQAIAFGNHEFDFGTGVVRQLITGEGVDGFDGTAFPYLSGNLDFSTDANLADLVVADGVAPQAGKIAGSTVFEVGGETIGVVAATTPTLARVSSPGGVGVAPQPFGANPTEAELDALATIIQADVDALLAANPGMNKVILLAHMQQIAIEQALAARLTDVDIIVAGGSNTRLFDENDRVRAGDSVQGEYPIFVENAGSSQTAVVNTDGSYKYLGRLVIDFDDNGEIIPESYDPTISGAFATDEQGLADLGAENLIDPEIQAIADSIREAIEARESNVFGVSDVFLNGNRSGVAGDPDDTDGVRTQETNLGNLTADANLAVADAFFDDDAPVVFSLKNGGGIRASIGQTIVPPGGTEAERIPNEAIPGVKPAGGVSENDIATTLAFNNGLILLTLTGAEIVALIEHGVSGLPGVAGSFLQIAGLEMAFDPTLPAGARVQSAALVDETGAVTVELVREGQLVNADSEHRIVTLSFLSAPRFDDDGAFIGGGDGYPFPNLDDPEVAARVQPVVLEQDDEAPRTGVATFAADGTEQDALAEYLAANFLETPYDEADTGRADDQRIQNLAFREDDVLDDLVVTGTEGRDRLTGTDFAETFVGLGGNGDSFTGLGGADTFRFGAELSDGARERFTITDYSSADGDVIMLAVEDFDVRFSGRQAIISAGDDRIYVRGDFDGVDDLTILTADDMLVA